ncbi:HAD family hydrolase [Haladaptatus sp. DYSN1]|nr:HAD family hydrolase [Haladaptatus sp. DYSN1]
MVIFGTDVPQVKPANDPFELALDRLRVEPKRVLKVGDSLSKDVKGANKLGLDSAWVPFDDIRRGVNDPEPTYTLSSQQIFLRYFRRHRLTTEAVSLSVGSRSVSNVEEIVYRHSRSASQT